MIKLKESLIKEGPGRAYKISNDNKWLYIPSQGNRTTTVVNQINHEVHGAAAEEVVMGYGEWIKISLPSIIEYFRRTVTD